MLAAAHCADQNGGWQTAECTLPFELTIDCLEGAAPAAATRKPRNTRQPAHADA